MACHSTHTGVRMQFRGTWKILIHILTFLLVLTCARFKHALKLWRYVSGECHFYRKVCCSEATSLLCFSFEVMLWRHLIHCLLAYLLLYNSVNNYNTTDLQNDFKIKVFVLKAIKFALIYKSLCPTFFDWHKVVIMKIISLLYTNKNK